MIIINRGKTLVNGLIYEIVSYPYIYKDVTASLMTIQTIRNQMPNSLQKWNEKSQTRINRTSKWLKITKASQLTLSLNNKACSDILYPLCLILSTFTFDADCTARRHGRWKNIRGQHGKYITQTAITSL